MWTRHLAAAEFLAATVAVWQSGFAVAMGSDHGYARCHSFTSPMKWRDAPSGGTVEGRFATEADRNPALDHASLKAPVCSWSDTTSKGAVR